MDWKKTLYYLPGVGLITHTLNEIKKRKGKRPIYNLKEGKDRKALGSFLLQTSYLAFAISSKLIVGAYVGNVMSTGEWNPFKQKIEKIEEVPTINKNNLEEKIIRYNDFVLKNL